MILILVSVRIKGEPSINKVTVTYAAAAAAATVACYHPPCIIDY